MQQAKELHATTAMATKLKYSSEAQGLRDKKVKDLMVDNKRRLVEVPYTASLAHTMNALVANRVVAVPVAAPPGHWIGAGGSMILEADKQTGAVRKHYIGMVTMLDILAQIADADDDDIKGGDGSDNNLDKKLSVEVSSIIGHCFEGLSLWTLNPNTSILDCMEVFSKGIHRAMVPLDSQMNNVSGVELVESASSYKMLTQMDVLRFLKQHDMELKSITSKSIKELGAITDSVFAISDRTKVIDAIKSMRMGSLNAVPIVTALDIPEEDHKQLMNGRGRKIIGTFSATDLRGCHLSALQTWLPLSALEFTEAISTSPLFADHQSNAEPQKRELVACGTESTLAQVIDKAVTNYVHRVWVVDSHGLLLGLVSLTDIIRVLRLSLLS
ncbi:SNF1-related protein kinase regulatory subunit gamma-like PV42a [Humulus lupulus]|uniref:SNF1-related protein kinase regulatory subunit gamma-like PV42a n=1 Tax=Humulus lupulus TaxID=3486 RepID=UPI002B4049BD|nr:SNF1-related protein kinase regulatory subunit gamma-like PV42a [Humulus lupulus]